MINFAKTYQHEKKRREEDFGNITVVTWDDWLLMLKIAAELQSDLKQANETLEDLCQGKVETKNSQHTTGINHALSVEGVMEPWEIT